MSIIEANAAPVNPEVLATRIGLLLYRITPLEAPEGTRAYQLDADGDGLARDVVQTADGRTSCTCGAPGECLHVWALQARGLLATSAAMPPDDGEGQGAPGEDLGPADPIDDLDDDPDAFPVWTDAYPDDDNRLTLPEFLAFTAAGMRRVGSGAALLVAETLDDLIAECRILGNPTTAEQFRDRRDAMLDVRHRSA